MEYNQIEIQFIKSFVPDWYSDFMFEYKTELFKKDLFIKFLIGKRKASPLKKSTINMAIEHIKVSPIKLYYMSVLMDGFQGNLMIAKNLRDEGESIYEKTVTKLAGEIHFQLKPFHNWLKREVVGGNWNCLHLPPKDFKAPTLKAMKIVFDGKEYLVSHQENDQVSYFDPKVGCGEDFTIFCLLKSYILTCQKKGVQEFDAMCMLLNRQYLEFMGFKHIVDDSFRRDVVLAAMIDELDSDKNLITPVRFKEIIMNHAGHDMDTFFMMKKVKSWDSLWQKAKIMCRGATCYEMAAGEFIYQKANHSQKIHEKKYNIKQWIDPNTCRICYRLCGGRRYCSNHDYRVNRSGYNRGLKIKDEYNKRLMGMSDPRSEIPFKSKELKSWLLIYAPTIAGIVDSDMDLLGLFSKLDDTNDPSDSRCFFHRLWCGLEINTSSDLVCTSPAEISRPPSSRSRARHFVLKAAAWEAEESRLKHGGSNRKRDAFLEDEIQKLKQKGLTQTAIGKSLGVSQALVSNCLN